MNWDLDKTTKHAILGLVVEHDGSWGWYQLHRALIQMGIHGVHVPTAVSALHSIGLLEFDDGSDGAPVRYRITEAGRHYICNLRKSA